MDAGRSVPSFSNGLPGNVQGSRGSFGLLFLFSLQTVHWDTMFSIWSQHAWPVENVYFSVFKFNYAQVSLVKLVQHFLSHLDWKDSFAFLNIIRDARLFLVYVWIWVRSSVVLCSTPWQPHRSLEKWLFEDALRWLMITLDLDFSVIHILVELFTPINFREEFHLNLSKLQLTVRKCLWSIHYRPPTLQKKTLHRSFHWLLTS